MRKETMSPDNKYIIGTEITQSWKTMIEHDKGAALDKDKILLYTYICLEYEW